MTTNDSNLFQVRFTDEGRKFIRRFAAISYTIFALVTIDGVIQLIFAYRTFEMNKGVGFNWSTISGYSPFVIVPAALVSNVYYCRFPRLLIRRIEQNDEAGANRAFRVLATGAVIFLVYLALSTLLMAWSLKIFLHW
jgi:hypothetical protein